MSISGVSLLLLAIAYARKACAPSSTGDPLRATSPRIVDSTASMSYFRAAASNARTLSYDVGISEGIGYKTVMRDRTNSASSDKSTTGRSSTVSLFGGWGSENISLNNGDEEANMTL